MNEVTTSPVLESVTRTGKKKYWQVLIVEEDDNFYLQTRYWQDTATGASAVQYSEPKYAHPTNVGRSNERDNAAQAIFEFDALIKKQLDKGYHAEGEESKILPLPMLANKWNDKKHTVTFPVYTQPKYDGVRMLMCDGKCWTRKGKIIIPEVVQHIACDTKGYILDGELILDGHTFQDTIRAVKKYREELSPQLKYYVFDVMVPDQPFSERNKIIQSLTFLPANMIKSPTIVADNEEELLQQHSEYILAGYEGTIIRTNGRYEANQRSNSLLKLKDFEDEEFRIVDVVEGEGRDAGAAIFVCRRGPEHFQVRPKGTIESRCYIFENAEDYIGKMLTVRFQGYSEKGVPRFPVGINVRDGDIQG